MLRRLFIALFALHFLLSLGGFTLHTAASAITESALTADVDGLDSSVKHGLTDDAPDMPDGPVYLQLMVRLNSAQRPATPWVFRTRDDPLRASLDRPPQRPLRA